MSLSRPSPTHRQVYRRDASAPNTLTLTTEPLPGLGATELPPHSLLIRLHAIALNYRDINILRGTNPWATLATGIPCSDAAGTVIAAGSGVTRFSVGDRVSPILDQASVTGREQSREWLGGEVDGVLATHVVFDEEKVVRIPEGLTFAEASVLPCAGVTAWSALAVGGEVGSGKVVLVQGTGGVSLLVLKLALAAGCRVIVTSSSDEKLEKVRRIAGRYADLVETINYKTNPKWEEEAVRLNGGKGVDIVIENGGTSSLLQSIAATAKRGIVSQVGYLGKQDAKDLEGLISALIDKTVTLRGINVGSRLEFEALNQIVSASRMRFEDLIDKTFAFEEAEEAFGYLKSQKHVGKVVIEIRLEVVEQT
ncbi:NAD(P)-binding protein [Mytilinidion resinicola]|uniref:NAD(P)-binding protein n=1 Tax=Mytilinidion resinicola TaxID=574789 RepID=A0A6A6YFP8_9PEZI|nr:NAD(P)-binding protein [Mytilinidion resinicola]KAF2806844.1 NAD(P)-binding protein [Mytilinidion resinicola]